jgi:hypothetical protein
MLRKFLFVSLAVITLASCKKDKDDAPAYNVSAKIDGVKKDFNLGAVATKQNFAGYYIVMINGNGGTTSSPLPAFTLAISDDVAIIAKTYTTNATDDNAAGSYTVSSQESYESEEEFSITVTSLTATEIKGTFSGKIEDGATTKNVTEGSFSAKFQ